jgi:VWFA-related protein
VTVTSGSGKSLARGLEESDFAVFDDGTPQQLVYFAAGRTPIALSLLIDRSGSMQTRLKEAQRAATQFTREMGPEDLVQVIDFDHRVRVLQDFTTDHTAVDSAIKSIEVGGTTALYTAVYVALRNLARLTPPAPDQIRRQAVVVLSDGDDTSSLVAFDQVLDELKRSNISVYSIGLRSPTDLVLMLPKKPSPSGDYVLRQFAMQTGGRAFFPQKINELADVYGEVAAEIGSQYVLGYVPTAARSSNPWHTVSVRVTKPGYTARTRAGYYVNQQ